MDSTNETRYNIVFDGKILDGADVLQVKTRMAALFKVDAGVIERIFRETPSVIQRNKDQATALKYKAAVEQTGVICRLERVPPQPAAPPPPPPPAAAPAPPAPGGGGTMYTPPAPAAEPVIKTPVIKGPSIASLDPPAWKSMAGGFVLAVGILMFPFLSYVFRYLIVLVHEIGHAVIAWLHGYPAVPAFDFMYGGGITSYQSRKIILVIIVYLLFAGLFYLYRKNPFTLAVLAVLVILHSIVTFTQLRFLLFLFMGHGFELIFAVVFLYRALSGSAVVVPAERPLYAFLGFFIVFIDFRFAYRLMTSSAYRADYGAAKGGGDWMDFSRIAHEFLQTELSSVAAFFLVLCMLTPVAAFLIFRYKAYLGAFFEKLLAAER